MPVSNTMKRRVSSFLSQVTALQLFTKATIIIANSGSEGRLFFCYSLILLIKKFNKQRLALASLLLMRIPNTGASLG